MFTVLPKPHAIIAYVVYIDTLQLAERPVQRVYRIRQIQVVFDLFLGGKVLIVGKVDGRIDGAIDGGQRVGDFGDFGPQVGVVGELAEIHGLNKDIEVSLWFRCLEVFPGRVTYSYNTDAQSKQTKTRVTASAMFSDSLRTALPS